jgi:hypothetical protein
MIITRRDLLVVVLAASASVGAVSAARRQPPRTNCTAAKCRVGPTTHHVINWTSADTPKP